MNRPPQSYYIASGLENAEQVRALRDRLNAAGWKQTYDWTTHGSVQKEGVEVIAEVASKEIEGVVMAEVFIALLPGGRGTHCELGGAITMSDCYVLIPGEQPAPLICVYSPDPERDFGTTEGKTCAFYHHPNVQRFGDLDEMVGWLLSE